jgi:ABC-type phosphate transport system substrate-binding protein
MPRTISALLTLAAAILLYPALPVGTSEPLGFAPQARAAADDSLGIVVNRSNPVENLSFAELRKIFLGEQTHWSNGRRITVVMLEAGKQERQAVLTQIYRMDDKDFTKHFLQGMFTGEIHAAPKILANSNEVLKFVLNVPGAIGYVRGPEADESVKVVRVDSRLPGDKDYSIRLHPKSGK